ncbi:MAG: hypothetical protein WBH03_23760, partial [Cyclobacteriaceae bacterium]
DKTATYTFQSTDGSDILTKGHDHTKKAVASTYINLTKYKNYDDHLAFMDGLARAYKIYKEKDFGFKLHITTDFFDNERNAKLNDLGRAVIIIHEGIHAAIHDHQPYPHIMSNLHGQHRVMGEHYLIDLEKSLKEFDSRLSDKQLYTLSISGLTHVRAGGNALIIEFARKVLDLNIGPKDEDEIQKVFENEYLSRFKKLTESPYEMEK